MKAKIKRYKIKTAHKNQMGMIRRISKKQIMIITKKKTFKNCKITFKIRIKEQLLGIAIKSNSLKIF